MGPKGDTGATGPQGPAGAAGGGAVLKDGKGVTLGTIVSAGAPAGSGGIAAQSGGVLIKTSTGYLLNVGWDGLAAKGQIYYTGAGCTGEAFWNAGNVAPATMYGNSAVYSHSLNQWLVTESPSNGFVTSAARPAGMAGQDNSGASGWNCRTLTTQPSQSAWKLRATNLSELGLPSMTGNQFALPLSIG
jgi:hypothetical protein